MTHLPAVLILLEAVAALSVPVYITGYSGDGVTCTSMGMHTTMNLV